MTGSALPQSSQKTDAGAFSAPHFEQRLDNGLPHAAQNFLPVLLSVPHFEQCMPRHLGEKAGLFCIIRRTPATSAAALRYSEGHCWGRGGRKIAGASFASMNRGSASCWFTYAATFGHRPRRASGHPQPGRIECSRRQSTAMRLKAFIAGCARMNWNSEVYHCSASASDFAPRATMPVAV